MILAACCIAVLVLLPACSSDKRLEPTPGDIAPPAAVLDLAPRSTGGSFVTLSWTAPGDDGASGQAARYDVRYSRTSLAGAGWDAATVAGPFPAPRPAGQVESFSVVDLADGVWYFALKAADEVPNWSAMSNSVSATLMDTIPPGAVTDLAAVSASFSDIRLSWSAPGNDGTIGRAAEYDLRRALSPITDETWDAAVRVAGLSRPAPAGQLRYFNVTGLTPGTEYHFALRTADGAQNWSAPSNGLNRSTQSIVISRLTTSSRPEGTGRPKWSPDGRTILTNTDWDQQYVHQLFQIPVDGGDRERLTHDEPPFHSYYPCCSPDGTKIAFSSQHSLAGDEIYTMSANPGAAAFQVTHLGIRNLHDCSWSPDGTRIAFTALVGDSPDHLTMTIYVVPSTGGLVRALTGAAPGQEPAWSPDGTRVAFASDRTGNYEIYTMPAKGGEPAQLTDDPANDMGPAWSSDGSQIAFSSDRGGSYDIWLMSSDGTNPIQLTRDPAWDGAPSWSPDGSQIAFRRWTSDWVGDIWILSGQ